MALTESDIKIIIAAELKKQGFDKAQKATSQLEKSFKRLGGTIASVFAAQKLITFTKQSAQAFAEEDKAVRSLATSMDNLGLAFEAANIEKFVADLQRSVSVSDSQLRPALQGLVNATLDVAKAQQLLGLGLDISAATGKDLTAVTTALSRAYLKDLTALSKLNIGLTAAQLKTMSFEEAQKALADRFGGQAAAAADSYQGKINALNIAFDEAQETIGQKFIRSLELLGDGNFDKVLDAIGTAADKIGNAFIRASYGVQKLKALLKGDFDQIQKLQESMNIELAGFGTKLGAAGAVQKMQQQLKVQKQIVAERKKAAALAEKEKKNQEKLSKAKALFDLEKIQIEAALKGKITQEERVRLELMKAIANEEADKAELLTEKLAKMQADTEKLANSLITLKAGDPFSEWDGYFANAQKLIDDLFANFAANAKVLNDLTKSITDSRAAANAAVMAAKTDKATAYSEAAQASGNFAALAAQDAAKAINDAAAAIAAATSPEEKAAAEEGMRAALEYQAGVGVLTESVAAAELASALAGLDLANEFLNESIQAATGQGLIPEVNVTVNVSGNITTEQDLVETITDQLYQYQKSGKGLLYSSVAI